MLKWDFDYCVVNWLKCNFFLLIIKILGWEIKRRYDSFEMVFGIFWKFLVVFLFEYCLIYFYIRKSV